MNNSVLIAIYTPFLLIAAVVFVLEIRRCIRTRSSALFVCMILSVMAWNISMMAVDRKSVV
jgi:hypothetical protein